MTRTTRIPVLMYHALANQRSPISLPPATFEAQMAALKARGVQTWTGGELRRWLDAGGPPTEPAVVITFDDGFRSVLRHALPSLARHGFRATAFLTTAHVGGRNDWPSQPQHVPRWELVTWAEARELAAAGIEIGAHSITHPWLPRLEPRELRRQVLGSQAAIADVLGQPVRSFAYPYGACDARVRAIVAEHFELAYTTVPGQVKGTSDRWRLPRIEVHDVRSPAVFRWIGSGMIDPWLEARRLLRLLRTKARPRWAGRASASSARGPFAPSSDGP